MLLVVASVCGGCSSGPGVLYHDGQPPRLKNGTVTMRTAWTPATDANPDVRRVKCRDGKITCELISRSRGHWQGDVPVKAWEKLWVQLQRAKPLERKPKYGVEPDDAQASGPYHVISIELDGRFHEFSAQLRRNMLAVFSSRDVSERLAYSDAVAELVQAYATTELKPPEAPKPAIPPKKKVGGGGEDQD